jgi:hypothetical protein
MAFTKRKVQIKCYVHMEKNHDDAALKNNNDICIPYNSLIFI